MGRGKAQKTLALVDAAKAILARIHPATVRAVCYQLFVLTLIDSMARKNTSKVSKQLTWARETGKIRWEWIVDETREAEVVPAWDDPAEFARQVSLGYRRDAWTQQAVRVEVWSEKGTMRGTLAPVLEKYGVTFRVMHGFTSATTAYDVAQQIKAETRRVVVFYIGDWDPSGLYMSEVDLPNRLAAYGAKPDEFVRVALDSDDVRDPTLPSFPATDKVGDPRYGWFVTRYGSRCWEVDALSPVVIRDRLEARIRAEIDWDSWQRCAVAERAETESLKDVLTTWAEVKHA